MSSRMYCTRCLRRVQFVNASSGELILVEILQPQAPRQELTALPRAPLQVAIADYPMILGDTGWRCCQHENLNYLLSLLHNSSMPRRQVGLFKLASTYNHGKIHESSSRVLQEKPRIHPHQQHWHSSSNWKVTYFVFQETRSLSMIADDQSRTCLASCYKDM